MSHTSASSAPPARQWRRTHAMVSLELATRARITPWNLLSVASSVCGASEATSKPAENTRSFPEKTIAVTLGVCSSTVR